MKKGLFFLILMIFSIVLKSQEVNLYVVAGQGCPANCYGETFPHYPVHMFKVKNGYLEKTLDISTGNEYVFKIAQYNAFKKVIVYKAQFRDKDNQFIIIDYSNNLQIDTIYIKMPQESFSEFTYYMVYYNSTPYIIFEYIPDFYKKFKISYFYGINLNTKKDTLFNNNIIQYLHSEGEQGLALVESTDDNSEIMTIRTKVINGQPYYYILYPRLYYQDTALFNIPKLDELSKIHKYILCEDKGNECTIFSIVNEDVICINSSIEYDSVKLQGNHKMVVYNKKSNNWKAPLFSGIFSNAYRQINDWIVGYEAYSYSLGFYQRMKKYGSIPGKKFRKDTSEYGIPFDERATNYKVYPVGVLYVYNINTQKYIEWEALENGERQGDSEILLVQDEMVYYRINYKIYQAPIINGEKLGASKLLVQDSRVPDIHWAFIAKN